MSMADFRVESRAASISRLLPLTSEAWAWCDENLVVFQEFKVLGGIEINARQIGRVVEAFIEDGLTVEVH